MFVCVCVCTFYVAKKWINATDSSTYKYIRQKYSLIYNDSIDFFNKYFKAYHKVLDFIAI